MALAGWGGREIIMEWMNIHSFLDNKGLIVRGRGYVRALPDVGMEISLALDFSVLPLSPKEKGGEEHRLRKKAC